MANSREICKLAPFIGGHFTMIKDGVMDLDSFLAIADLMNLDLLRSNKEESLPEEIQCLTHLLGSLMEVEAGHIRKKLTVGEVVTNLYEMHFSKSKEDNNLPGKNCLEEALPRYGMKLLADTGMLFVQSKNPELRKIFLGTNYINYAQFLGRLKGAIRNQTLRIKSENQNNPQKGVSIPYSLIEQYGKI
jgi:hypothetical protein